MMTNRFNAKETSLVFVANLFKGAFTPFRHMWLPIKWSVHSSKEQNKLAKRVILGILLTLPCLMFILLMLSSADTVFSNSLGNVFKTIIEMISFDWVVKVLFGCGVALYAFGLFYCIFTPRVEPVQKEQSVSTKPSGDLVIMNILLFSVLVIYTVFVFLQFKYLFARSALPYGLNYADYARRGFFELVFLSGINVGFTLIAVYLLRDKLYNQKSAGGFAAKIGLLYLCGVTVVMLCSSFYRMSIYDSQFGFTQLRVLVYGFLIFEAVGLIATFVYVLKPKFNILLVYAAIALSYYMAINVANIDAIVAKRNVDRFFEKKETDFSYLLWLSPDAAPQIARLLEYPDLLDPTNKDMLDGYFKRISQDNYDTWQEYNLSVERAKTLANNIQKS